MTAHWLRPPETVAKVRFLSSLIRPEIRSNLFVRRLFFTFASHVLLRISRDRGNFLALVLNCGVLRNTLLLVGTARKSAQ